jgi:hypothetical protein
MEQMMAVQEEMPERRRIQRRRRPSSPPVWSTWNGGCTEADFFKDDMSSGRTQAAAGASVV